ncbi:MAG: MFS transporter [Polaromonas sp.]|nr:MAG: MFS transporter [Polaromonas sp.]
MSASPPSAFGWRNGLAYGLMGLPLAFVALPLYVILPNHYAKEFGVPLATLGAILLGARLFDAFIDPLLGRLSDRLFARSPTAVLKLGALAAVVLALGFALLFFPQVRAPGALIVWASVMLMVTYAAYSFLSVSHQSWGAMLGGNEAERSRIVAWREALGLVGVVMASITPVALGLPATTALFSVALVLGWLAWTRAQPPVAKKDAAVLPGALWLPFAHGNFKRLLLVFMLNGTASAVPATLVLFFIQDRLQAPSSQEPLFLGSYFLTAALSIPLWLAVVKRIGLARAWLMGMALSMAVFVWATQIGSGQTVAFLIICALSGVALGTDLALPGALLAGVIQSNGDSGRAEGAYFGWWNFAIKLNLALAAGLALPLLGVFGYAPGVRSPEALNALVIAYCVLPCALKLAASAGLYFLIIQPSSRTLKAAA